MLQTPTPAPRLSAFFRTFRITGASALLGLLVAAAPQPVSAQQLDLQMLQQRVQRLESDLSILQRQVYTGAGGATSSPPPRPVVGGGGGSIEPTVAASFEVRISQLEDQMQSLTGRIEEIGHNTDLLKTQLDRLQKDIEFRLSALEKGGAAPAGAGSAPGAGPEAATTPTGAQEAPPPPAGKLSLGPGQVLPVGTAQQHYV